MRAWLPKEVANYYVPEVLYYLTRVGFPWKEAALYSQLSMIYRFCLWFRAFQLVLSAVSRIPI